MQSVLSRAKAEKNRAKDQLTTVKTRVKDLEVVLTLFESLLKSLSP